MNRAENIVKLLSEHNLILTTAESCTGGMLAAAITDVRGASKVFQCGVVSYGNNIKEMLLQVERGTLFRYGAVSYQTAQAMALGALDLSDADIAISITGLAGPDGGSLGKPVGLVYIGLANREGKVSLLENYFSGSREEIRKQTVEAALNMLETYLIAIDRRKNMYVVRTKD